MNKNFTFSLLIGLFISCLAGSLSIYAANNDIYAQFAKKPVDSSYIYATGSQENDKQLEEELTQAVRSGDTRKVKTLIEEQKVTKSSCVQGTVFNEAISRSNRVNFCKQEIALLLLKYNVDNCLNEKNVLGTVERIAMVDDVAFIEKALNEHIASIGFVSVPTDSLQQALLSALENGQKQKARALTKIGIRKVNRKISRAQNSTVIISPLDHDGLFDSWYDHNVALIKLNRQDKLANAILDVDVELAKELIVDRGITKSTSDKSLFYLLRCKYVLTFRKDIAALMKLLVQYDVDACISDPESAQEVLDFAIECCDFALANDLLKVLNSSKCDKDALKNYLISDKCDKKRITIDKSFNGGKKLFFLQELGLPAGSEKTNDPTSKATSSQVKNQTNNSSEKSIAAQVNSDPTISSNNTKPSTQPLNNPPNNNNNQSKESFNLLPVAVGFVGVVALGATCYWWRQRKDVVDKPQQHEVRAVC